MKVLLALAASAACALAACSTENGLPTSIPPPAGDQAPPNGSEPTGGGPEPGISGQDPPPGGRTGNSVAAVCGGVCARFSTACGANSDQSQCVAGCTADVSNAGKCQSLYLDALTCILTVPITCSGMSIQIGGCYTEIIALDQCMSSTTTPPTTGGMPGGTPTTPASP